MNPTLLQIPETIETERLLIRSLKPGDGTELNAAILETWDELAAWIPWAKAKPTVDETESKVRQCYSKWILREDLRMLIVDKKSGRIAGESGFYRLSWNVPWFEAGYWVSKPFMGRGYATETTNALTRFAFQELKAKRVELKCEPSNAQSVAIPKKLGFIEEGRLRNIATNVAGTEPRDLLVFARVDDKGLPPLNVKWPAQTL